MTGSPAGDTGTSPARTVFFGSGPFAVPILEALLEVPAVRIVAAVTAPDRPAGRGRRATEAPLARAAAARNVPVLQPASLRGGDAVEAIDDLEPALGVLADYGRIVPQNILDLPGHGFLNVHPSLLPRHRGATPIAAAILSGDAEAGVTIFRMDAGLDTGPIVDAESWPLDGRETAPELERRAAEVGARLIARVVPGWLAGDLRAKPQSDELATLTRLLRRDDGRLDGRDAAAIVERRIRAYAPWPGTFIELADTSGGVSERVAILHGAVGPSGDGDVPGRLVADDGGIALTTADGRLRILDVRPAGGRSMTGAAWRRGRPNLLGLPVADRATGDAG